MPAGSCADNNPSNVILGESFIQCLEHSLGRSEIQGEYGLNSWKPGLDVITLRGVARSCYNTIPSRQEESDGFSANVATSANQKNRLLHIDSTLVKSAIYI